MYLLPFSCSYFTLRFHYLLLEVPIYFGAAHLRSFTEEAVSYTHLDVYKRQLVYRGERSESFDPEKHFNRYTVRYLYLLNIIALKTVSYTHLPGYPPGPVPVPDVP